MFAANESAIPTLNDTHTYTYLNPAGLTLLTSLHSPDLAAHTNNPSTDSGNNAAPTGSLPHSSANTR